jgi:hypothetical protein
MLADADRCVFGSAPIASNRGGISFTDAASAHPSAAAFTFWHDGPAAAVASVGTDNSLLRQSDVARLAITFQFIT